jgi:hypothetical protein
MTPKHFCYLTIMLISNLAIRAQDRRTLEISETDTVFLKPISIQYLVSKNGSSGGFANFGLGKDKKSVPGSDEVASSMETVKGLLRSHQMQWESGREGGYAIGRSAMQRDSLITITVHSEEELKSVYMLLSPLTGITASVSQIDYEPSPNRISVYKRLYQRAMAEAAQMAAISGKTLGELISVEEPQDLLWSMRQNMEAMEPATNFVAEMIGSDRGRIQKKEQTKILFKFELK